ncbi:MAG: type II toxin-antitoxin system YafQ family toxin [Acidobacteria bacterium]|nr:type II toxin-antitoxin system YafQ family toxin [Acidobacteriota bacterium]
MRAAKKVIRHHPERATDIRSALELLTTDAFHPQLKTHKLKGDLQGYWACSAAFDLRIVFRLVQYEGTEAVYLEAIGSHDEVY